MCSRSQRLFFDFLLMVLLGVLIGPQAHARNLSMAEKQKRMRIRHARELMGPYYKKSVVRTGENIARINRRIYRWTRERLPQKYRHEYKRVAQTIIDEAARRQLDPVFIMSVIQRESSFNPVTRGPVDEIGLMQLRPATAEWMAKKYGMRWRGSKSLLDPSVNIRIGAAYLAYLREKFDSHAQLYIAAYNMGARNVASVRSNDIWPKQYPGAVMRHYVSFYASLQRR